MCAPEVPEDATAPNAAVDPSVELRTVCPPEVGPSVGGRSRLGRGALAKACAGTTECKLQS